MKKDVNTKRAIVIGVGCFLMAAAGFGMVGAKSQYIVAVCADLGYSTGFMTTAASLASLATAVTCLFFSSLQRLFKTMRGIILTGMIAMSAGYLLPAVLHNKVGFIIGFALQGIGLACLGDVPLSTLVNNWFRSKPGTVLGFCFMGSGVGGMVFNPITGFLIKTLGWKGSYWITAAVTVILLLPILLFGRGRPADAEMVVAEKVDERKEEKIGFSKLVRLPNFMPFLVVALLAGCCIPAVNQNASPILDAAGIDPMTTSFILSVIYAALSVAKIVMGYCNDRFGARVAISIQTASYVIAVILLIVMTEVTQSAAIGFMFAVIFGLSYSWQSLAQPSALRVLFDKAYFSSCLGITVAVLHFGSAISSAIAGFVKDATGSYTPILVVYAIAVTLAFAGYQILFARRKRMIQQSNV